MNIAGLSSAARTALNGLGDVFQKVERVAEDVASAPATEQSGSFSRSLGAIARLPELRQEALANARVFSTTEELFNVLSSLPRK